MCGVISTEFPQLTAGNFESSLASDDVLAHFFNDFLSLPSFPEDLLYNQQTGLFEVVSDAAEFVSRRIRSVLCTSRSQLLTGDPPQLARAPPLDNHYAVCCLDREQGSQWVKRERLPFFLQSDCYYEYRRKSSLCRSTPSGPGLEVRTCSRSQENSSAQQGFSSSHLQCEEAVDLQSSQEQRDAASSRRVSPPVEQQLDYLAAGVVQQVLRDAVNVMDGRSQSDSSGCFSQSGDGTDRKSADTSCECKVWSSAEDGEGSEGKKEKVQDAKRESEWEGKTDCDEKNRDEGSRGTHHKNGLNICCHGTCCHGIRSGLDEFKEFLRGTQGEKLLNFWMDIERLKATQRKSRCLALMRSSYLWSSSHRRLNLELLSTLGLTTSPCWTDQKLRSVQPYITESLLYYWAPRFWTSRRVQADRSDSPPERCCSSAGMQPGHGSITLPLLRPDTCSPSYTVHTQLLSSRGQSLYSRRTERMLQALCVDLRAGLYFTHFCEQSGNQLWVNAVYFWADLQQYHELFHQDGPDPYRVQREAQVSTNTDSCTPPPLTPELLYSTYLFSCGGRSIGVNEEMRREVYDKLMPAVEELFDGVKEHTLSLLLEAWTLLVNRDHESFQQVCVQQEVRSINSEEFRELQSLYEESEQQLPQVLFPSSATPPFSKGPHASDSWSTVPPNYHGYRLGSLLRHRHEIGHFMCFLQRREASVHLSCWLDLEQYRRTPQKDEAVRRERSAHIAAKYLNRKYFFGPDSPATTEQQNDILHLAGGLERLKSECLSNAVAVEMEDITRRHIEKTWLPEFLSTAEFTERHKHQPEPPAADRLSQHVYRGRRTRTAAWKAKDSWMSSSTEILLFRRVLLNPVTCQQFQHFVYLKGGFLENDVRFWLEVQRYKDLCHSHSDEATIQQKISTIISCFVDSSVPPALQIDVLPQQAKHILDQRHQLGPYIFREAQMSVFSELLRFWPEFQELSSSTKEEQLLPLLQEQRVKYRVRVRRQRRREEEEQEHERRAQEALERRELSWEDETDDDDDDDDDETEKEQERRSEKQQWRTRSRALLTSTQTLSWSYSKYMAALKREEVLLRRRSQLETSTTSDSSSDCSVQSASRKQSYRQASHRSSRTDGTQRDTYNRK